MKEPNILRIEKITKQFPGVKALDQVSLSIQEGKVHALMGENGAGKSTLMKILIGLLKPDEGALYWNEQKVHFNSVHEALNTGLSMIHQELMPFLNLTVAENIFMGKEPVSKFPGWIRRRKLNAMARSLMKQLDSDIDVTSLMKGLNVAQMQLVEIAKAISNNARVIIMDEPTSALTDQEVRVLFKIIEELKSQGIAIIYISHKMDEILQISDTISVMRDGKYIGTYEKEEVTKEKLISLIVGRELIKVDALRKNIPGEVVLSVQGLTGEKFRNINFDVHKGEIIGMAGLMGSGRSEIVKSLFGLEKIKKGKVMLHGKNVQITSPAAAIKNGIGLVCEDRKTEGVVLPLTVKENISLASLRNVTKGIFISNSRENKIVDQQIKSLRIKTPSRNQVVNYLSGGNQQKVVLAKVLLNDPDVLILDEPTKGIDIGAKTEIYNLINQLASNGKAIIVVSSELPEILQLSDRILVIHNGVLKANLKREEASQELIMKYSMS